MTKEQRDRIDAARYRFLRDQSPGKERQPLICIYRGGGLSQLTEEEADSEIDAAMHPTISVS